jgi:hypothetical protein
MYFHSAGHVRSSVLSRVPFASAHSLRVSLPALHYVSFQPLHFHLQA